MTQSSYDSRDVFLSVSGSDPDSAADSGADSGVPSAAVPGSAPTRRAAARVLLAAAALALLAAFLRAAESLPLTWDEGDAFNRAERVAEWTDALLLPGRVNNPDVAAAENPTLADPTLVEPADLGDSVQRRELRRYFATLPDRGSLFRPDVLAVGFPHAIHREGHPAGYSELIAFGAWLAQRLRLDKLGFSPKVGLRFGQTLLFLLALVALWRAVTRSFGPLAGACALVGVVSCPRVFCHALIAGGDSLMISSWLLAFAAWTASRRSIPGAIALGLAAGASFSAKYSGLAIFAPIGLTAAADAVVIFLRVLRRRVPVTAAIRSLFGVALRFVVVCLAAGLFFLLLNPTLWHDFPRSLLVFWRLNTTRDGLNIPTYFFGEYYSLDRALPWWNGLFWILATTPTPLLVLALGAVGRGILTARRDAAPVAVDADVDSAPAASATFLAPLGDRTSLVLFAAIAGLTLPLVRAIPGLPVHDAARLMIASMSFWGVLGGLGSAFAAAALGAFIAVRFARPLARPRVASVGAVVVAAALLAPGVVDVFRAGPSYLSFYSAAVGGVRGAASLKLEPTYYWDGLDGVVVGRLRELVREAQEEGRPDGILFSAYSSQNLDFLRRWDLFGTQTLGTVSNPAVASDISGYGFYVMQMRPSAREGFDYLVEANAPRLLTKRVGDPIPIPWTSGDAPDAIVVYQLQ